jgi:magnesium transporter
MAAAQDQQPIDRLNEVVRAHGRAAAAETKLLLASLRPADLANLLESNPPKVRQVLWELLEEEPRNQTLQHLTGGGGG